MGNICRKTDKDPDSAWRQQNIEVATNPMYQYCNFTNGGKLLDAYNAGGIPAVEKLAKTEIATFLYNNGDGATINKIDFIKWKSRCEAKITVCVLIKPFTPTECFSSIQNNDWKSPLKLLSVERVNSLIQKYGCFLTKL